MVKLHVFYLKLNILFQAQWHVFIFSRNYTRWLFLEERPFLLPSGSGPVTHHLFRGAGLCSLDHKGYGGHTHCERHGVVTKHQYSYWFLFQCISQKVFLTVVCVDLKCCKCRNIVNVNFSSKPKHLMVRNVYGSPCTKDLWLINLNFDSSRIF